MNKARPAGSPAGSGPPIAITGDGLTIAELSAIARRRAEVTVAPDAVSRMARAAQALAAHLASGGPVYGVTTGLGARVGEAIGDHGGFAEATLRGRAVAVGEPLPAEIVRAAMAVRLAGLAAGGSGAGVDVAAGLAGLLNAGVHPVVPRVGSLGAADLCLLAHVGLVLIGDGEAEYGGAVMPGAQALRAARLAPVGLGPRDGLVICSSSAVSVGTAALALLDAQTVLDAAQISAALAMEAFRAGVAPIDPRVVAARPAPGQRWAADGLRALLAGGALTEPGAARRLQDPLSFRCASQIHGSLRVALDGLREAVEPELGAAADSPLVLGGAEGGTGGADGAGRAGGAGAEVELVSTGNFHGPALSLALDGAAIAAAQVGEALAARPARLAAARFSGLPEGLAASPRNSGVAPLEKTGRALALELAALATPRSVGGGAAADGAEDDVTGALPGALRLHDSVRALARLVAIELVVAACGVELRDVPRLGIGTAAALAWVRERVPAGGEDRPLGPELERLSEAILGGELGAVVP